MRLTNQARRVVLTIGIILGLILLVLVSLSLLVRIPSIQAQIRPRIESELLAALDREVEIGEVRLGLLPLSFDIRNIRIASRKRLEEGVLAEIDGVEVYPSLGEARTQFGAEFEPGSGHSSNLLKTKS